jgi:hypothetical protein
MTNPLSVGRRTEQLQERTHSTNLDDYCAWLNAARPNTGPWVIRMEEGKRTLSKWHADGTEGWMREKGFLPQIGKRA